MSAPMNPQQDPLNYKNKFFFDNWLVGLVPSLNSFMGFEEGTFFFRNHPN